MKHTSWLYPCIPYGESIQEEHLGGTAVGGDAATWFPELWDWLIHRFEVKSMFDVGCGCGFAVEFFQKNNVDSYGADGADGCIAHSRVPDRVIKHDFSKGPYLTEKKYDLVWSCEFLEHVDSSYVGNILISLQSLTNKVLAITAAPPYVTGHHHVNCQEMSYWIELLRLTGFKYEAELTAKAKELFDPKAYGRDVEERAVFHESGMIFTTGRSHNESI